MSFFQSAVISSNAICFWDGYLLHRQRCAYFTREVPEAFKSTITQEEFDKSQAYGKERTAFGIVQHVKDFILGNAMLLLKVPAKLYYSLASHTNITVGSFTHTFLYSVTEDVLSTLIDIPFSYYHHFVIEKAHGFNKMTRMDFVKDTIKHFLVRLCLLHPIQTALIQFVVQKFGENFPIYFLCAASVLVFAFTFIFPTFIQPLFNKFTPLDETGGLYKKIQALAESQQFPLRKVYVVDGSRRSSHSNAYMYGFWKNKRIVLYDTLLSQMENDEQIVAVLAHELGHWKLNHTSIMLGAALAQLTAFSYGAKAVIFNGDMYKQFGFREMNPVVGFGIYMEVFLQPMSTFLGYALSYVSRVMEFQADRFAVSLGNGEDLVKALVIMQKENKSGLTPDPLYAALTYSHPPMIQRLEAIEAELKKAK